MRISRWGMLVTVVLAIPGCASTSTKIGGVTLLNPLCIGLVKANGFCAKPPLPDRTGLHIDDCVRVTYRPGEGGLVVITKITKVSAAAHRKQCPS